MPIQKAGRRFRNNASVLTLRVRPFGATRSKIDFAIAGDTGATMYPSMTGGQGWATEQRPAILVLDGIRHGEHVIVVDCDATAYPAATHRAIGEVRSALLPASPR